MLDWNDVRYLVAVAETGSTLAAGRRLGVSQTTAARRIVALEEALGVTLFERRPAGYRLTHHGQNLLPLATGVANEIDRLATEAAALVRDVGGTVRLTIADIYGVTILAPILRDLHQIHPRIRIELDTTDKVRDLAMGDADIAIRSCTRPAGAGLVGRCVGKDNWSVYCSRGYAAEHGQPRRRSELSGHTMIGGGEPGIRRYYRAWLEHNNLVDAVAMYHDTSIGMLSSVRSGLGIAVLPCLVADQDRDLLRCLPPDPANERGLWLLVHERIRKVPRIRATLDFLGSRLTQLQSPIDS